MILSAVAFGGIVYGLSGLGAVATTGITTATWVSLGAGAIALVVFVLRQLQLQKVDDALLDLRTFSSSTFTISVGVMAISMMSLFGTLILVPLYAQTVLGLEALQTGLLLLPGGLIMGLLAPSVGRAYDRFGPRPLLVPGAIIVSASAWGFTLLGATSSPWLMLACHVTLSAGLALMFTPLFTSALGSLPMHLYSHGSAMVGTVQQVAGAAGTALFVTVLTAQSATLAAAGSGVVDATAGGIHAAFLVGAVISLAAIPAAFFVKAAPSPHGAPVDEAAPALAH